MLELSLIYLKAMTKYMYVQQSSPYAIELQWLEHLCDHEN